MGAQSDLERLHGTHKAAYCMQSSFYPDIKKNILKQWDKIVKGSPTDSPQERGLTCSRSMSNLLDGVAPRFPCNVAIMDYNLNVKFKMHYFDTVESH